MLSVIELFVFKQKTAYWMRISDWSSDVCSSDLWQRHCRATGRHDRSVRRDGRDARPESARRDWRRRFACPPAASRWSDRKRVVEGTSVSVRVDLGVCRSLRKKHTILTSLDP